MRVPINMDVLDVPKRYTRTSLTVMFVTDLLVTLQDIIGLDDPKNGRHGATLGD
jgi:hypothetical protein